MMEILQFNKKEGIFNFKKLNLFILGENLMSMIPVNK